jgi:hypothetical protein
MREIKMNNKKNTKKIIVSGLCVLLLAVAILFANFGAMGMNVHAASVETSVTATKNLSTKSALILRNEYAEGLRSNSEQWSQYEYDLRTFDEYDYIEMSVSVSSTVELSEVLSKTVLLQGM